MFSAILSNDTGSRGANGAAATSTGKKLQLQSNNNLPILFFFNYGNFNLPVFISLNFFFKGINIALCVTVDFEVRSCFLKLLLVCKTLPSSDFLLHKIC